MESNQPYSIYLNENCFCSQDAYIAPVRIGKKYTILEMLVLAFQWLKTNEITKIIIYSNFDLLKLIRESQYKEIFDRDIFPYFVDFKFQYIELTLIEEYITKARESFLHKDYLKTMLLIQENILHNKKIKKINTLKRGGYSNS